MVPPLVEGGRVPDTEAHRPGVSSPRLRRMTSHPHQPGHHRHYYRVGSPSRRRWIRNQVAIVNQYGIQCPDCRLTPYLPVTGRCGHTRCQTCIQVGGNCPCGEAPPERLVTDILVRKLIDELRFRSTLPDEEPQHHKPLVSPAARSRDEPASHQIDDQETRPATPGSSRENVAHRWLDGGDLDCILCGNIYRRPVTTPCGHTYCRYCIERALGYRWPCPLCTTSLERWDLDASKDNVLVTRAIEATGIRVQIEEYVEDENRLPIFVCTVAYPKVPCPLQVFEPRYRLMIKRCLLSKSKRFGMVDYDSESEWGHVEYGTILEIRDCVRFPSGRFILSTMGITRFRIVERGSMDGYDVAAVEMVQDIATMPCYFPPHTSTRILYEMACHWVGKIRQSKLEQVVATYGCMPPYQEDEEATPDGPAWIWWILALLPLSGDLKVLILSSRFLHKRLKSVIHTLRLLDYTRAQTKTYADAAFLAVTIGRRIFQTFEDTELTAD